MIPRRAIEAFKADCQPSLIWTKSASEHDLDEILSYYRPHTRMWRHQKICMFLGIRFPQLAFFLEMGLGKSLITLSIFDYEYQQRKKVLQPTPKGLILVPNLTNIAGWEEQITSHTPHLKAEYLYGSTDERLETLEGSEADLFVINYAGLCALVSTLQHVPGKKKSKRVPDLRLITVLGKFFEFMICDESTAMKNHQTLTYTVCKKLAEWIPRRYILTGTPFGTTPHDLWAQYSVLDHGQTFGKTLGIFRAAYFSEKKNYWGGYEYKFLERTQKDVARKLEGSSVRYKTDECLDLPDMITTPLHVPMTDEMQVFHGKVHKAAVKQAVTAVEIENHFVKLRMIASGYAKHHDKYIDFRENPKLDAAIELLREMPSESKAVVFHFFIHSGELLSQALKKESIKHVRIWSATKDKAEALKKFTTDSNTRVLVINESIGAIGLNLQIANYLLFYECPVEPIKLQQAMARCRRPGQKHTVFCYFPMVKGSVDEKIHLYSQKGMNLLKELLDKKELLNFKK